MTSFGLPDAQAPDRAAVKVHAARWTARSGCEGPYRTPLHNPKQRLVRARMATLLRAAHLCVRSMQASRAHSRRERASTRQTPWRCRAKVRLHLIDTSGEIEPARAVDVRGKRCPFPPLFSSSGKRIYLKAAAVRQNRPLPAHEGVQAARALDDALPRAQKQVIGI